MAPRKSVLIILAVITLLFTLVCIALYGYHAEVRCYGKALGVTTRKCQSGQADACVYGYAVSTSGTLSGVDYKASITCPFRTATTVLGLLGFVGTLFLLVLFFLATRGKALGRPIAALGGLIIAVLLSSFGLMIADVIHGANYAEDTNTTDVLSPGSYVANIILALIGIIFIGVITYYGYKSEGNIGSSRVTVIASPQPVQFQQLNGQTPNASYMPSDRSGGMTVRSQMQSP